MNKLVSKFRVRRLPCLTYPKSAPDYMSFGSFSSLFIALCSSSDVPISLTSEFLDLASCLTLLMHSFASLIDKQLSRTFPTNITSAINQRAPWSKNKLSHIIILLTILPITNVLKTSFSKSQRTSLWSDLSSAQARETISLKIFIYFTIDGCSFIKLFCYECVRCEGCQCLRFACFWTCTVVSSPATLQKR